jgi:hypothetical protein
MMSPEELTEAEVAEVLDPELDLLEMEVESSSEPADAEEPETVDAPVAGEGIAGQTGSVRIYDVGCSTGAGTSFLLPITAFYWNARLGYFRSDGSRIGLSSIVRIPRSYYAGVTLRARFNGRLPAGLRDLRAFWWYGPPEELGGPVYWNRISHKC